MGEFDAPATQWQILKSEGYNTLKLSGDLSKADSRIFEANDLSKLTAEPLNHIVINCEHLSLLSKQWIRVLVNIAVHLKKFNKGVRLVRATKEVLDQIKHEGVDTTLKSVPNLRDALIQFGLVTKKALDVDFVNPFLQATMHALKVQAQTQSTPGKMYLKKKSDKYSGDISGVIGLVSETFNGAIVISFPEKTFLAVISKMIGEEVKEISKEVADGAGELTNIIFGQAKVILNEKGYGIKTAIPSVVTGKDHSVANLTDGPAVVVPFESDAGPFFIEICISS